MEKITVSMYIPKTDKKWEEIICAIYELRDAEKKNRMPQLTYISPDENLIRFLTVTVKGDWTFNRFNDCIEVSFTGTPGAFATGSSALPTWRIIEHGAERVQAWNNNSKLTVEGLYVLWQGKHVLPVCDQFPALGMLSHAATCCKHCNEVALLRKEAKMCSSCFSAQIRKGKNTQAEKIEPKIRIRKTIFVIEEIRP